MKDRGRDEDDGRRTEESAEVREAGDLESLCAVEQVREVEVGRVVADDHVWVDLLDEVGPLLQKLLLLVVRQDLRADDVRARVEGEDVADEWGALAWRKMHQSSAEERGSEANGWRTLPGDHVCDLDDGIDLGLGEDALPARTLDVEAENT